MRRRQRGRGLDLKAMELLRELKNQIDFKIILRSEVVKRRHLPAVMEPFQEVRHYQRLKERPKAGSLNQSVPIIQSHQKRRQACIDKIELGPFDQPFNFKS